MSKFKIVCIACLSCLFSFLISNPLISLPDVYGQSLLGNIFSSLIEGSEKSRNAESESTQAEIDKKYESSNEVAEANGNKKVREEEQNIMEEALALLEESEEYWKKGDLENALDLLDQAYALIIETDDDPAIARQKDDLRLLISKRILAIYTSRQTVTVGKRSEIPITMNADVEKEIRSFQSFERDFFIAAYRRSGFYRPMIVKELKKAGLPEELSWLPLVESGFKISALSRARALGLWQFIPSTGYKYGLNRDEWIDERMDGQKSTHAAIGYLKDLHNMFGDWLTVLAAYNCGEGRVLRVISGQHLNYLDRFWDLYHQLPYETARYVPRFLATIQIIKDPVKYGMDLGQPLEKEIPFEEVKTEKNMRLQDIAAALEIPEDTLNNLNTELRHKMTPDREYQLKVPLEMAEKLVKVADSIPQGEKPKLVRVTGKGGFKRHKVKRGETMASIAHRYNISVSALRACNNLSGKKGPRVGQRLKVPVRTVRYAKGSSRQQPERDKTPVNGNGQIIRYKVKKGDSLSSLAQRFNTTSSEIKRMNRIRGRTGALRKHGEKDNPEEKERTKRHCQ
ncbi:MAG: LysM peptidoglycan-binding domain-containing protein [Deltaproteobacteria bacterium]|nr:LysM peptidoglycan-binding domain-containing protein [Deltaproteobacteria bacterium]